MHSQIYGSGETRMLALHGWAMAGAAFAPLAEGLAIEALDLPGHGATPCGSGFDKEAVYGRMAELLADGGPYRGLLGWSLGGMLALEFALRYPGLAAKIVVVGTSAKFVADAGWLHGMEEGAFAQFARGVVADPDLTRRRFVALQAMGCVGARKALQELLCGSAPDAVCLRESLDVLWGMDLRSSLPSLATPVLLIQGGRDRICQPQAARATAALLPDALYWEVPTAGHAPFVEDGAGCAAKIVDFLSYA